ncbi:MAG: hypothetical protein P8X55_01035 [Desulfosarcinaceae bacterium]
MRPGKFICLLLSILVVLATAAGCTGPRHTKLSESAEKASDDHKGDRVVESGRQPHPHPWHHHRPADAGAMDEALAQETQPAGTTPSASPQGSREPGVFALGAGYGLIKGEDFYQLNQIDLSLGGYLDEKNRLEGFLGYGQALIDETSDLHRSIKDASILSIGMRYKYFTTPRYTFLGHYFTLGLAYSKLSWSYENAVFLDGREIGHDSLLGMELFAGMGLHLVQTEHIQLGIEVLPSMTLWSAYTDEGFDNDVFGPLYMLKLRLTLSFL